MAESHKQPFTPSMLFGTFYPTGYLIAVVPDQQHAEQAKAAVQDAGFSEVDAFSGQQVLAHHQELMDSRTPLERIGSIFGADEKLIQEDYLSEARAGKLILAVHVEDQAQLEPVRQALVEQQASMLRYYSAEGVIELSP